MKEAERRERMKSAVKEQKRRRRREDADDDDTRFTTSGLPRDPATETRPAVSHANPAGDAFSARHEQVHVQEEDVAQHQDPDS